MEETITSLIEKLEGAEVGSRELDADVALQVGWTVHPGDNWIGPHAEIAVPDYTTSLDDALALADRVLPGHDWSLGHLPTSDDADHQEHHEFGCFFYAHPHVASRQDGLGHGATAPLAMVTAILRAHSEARV